MLRSLLLLPLVAAPFQDTPEDAAAAELRELADSIAKDVERLRGREFLGEVEVSVATPELLVEYARARLAEFSSPETLRAEEELAKLFGLLPADYDLVESTFAILEEQVGGFYDPAEDEFYVMESVTGLLAKVTFAHELTHALDDQHFDIDERLGRIGDDLDAALAYFSVVEGSGTAVMSMWVADAMKSGKIGFSDMGELMEMPGFSTDELDDAPDYLWKSFAAPYLVGEAFLKRTSGIVKAQLKQVAPEDIDAAFRDPPVSSEQVLHPEKYWDEEERDDPVEVRIPLERLPEGWDVRYETTLGEMHLASMVTPADDRGAPDFTSPTAIFKLDFTSDAAEGWGGDRTVLLAKESARIGLLVTRWDTVEDAEEFEEALEGVLEVVAASAVGVLPPSDGEVESGTLLFEGSERPDARVFCSYAGIGSAEALRVVAALGFE